MSRFGILLAALFSMFFCYNVYAQETTVVEKRVIITPAPKSAKCTTVAGHWEANIWVAEQTICTYEGRAEGVAWVQDYWACTASTADGNCTTWEYRPGHWVKTLP